MADLGQECCEVAARCQPQGQQESLAHAEAKQGALREGAPPTWRVARSPWAGTLRNEAIDLSSQSPPLLRRGQGLVLLLWAQLEPEWPTPLSLTQESGAPAALRRRAV